MVMVSVSATAKLEVRTKFTQAVLQPSYRVESVEVAGEITGKMLTVTKGIFYTLTKMESVIPGVGSGVPMHASSTETTKFVGTVTVTVGLATADAPLVQV